MTAVASTSSYTSPYTTLLARYRAARSIWAADPRVRFAAHTIAMSEREYCDRYVAQFPILHVAADTTAPPSDAITAADVEHAYAHAAP